MNYTKLNWYMVTDCMAAIDRVQVALLHHIFNTSLEHFSDRTGKRVVLVCEVTMKCRKFVYRAFMRHNPGQKEVRICNKCGDLMIGTNCGSDFTGEDWHYECLYCGYSEHLHVAI